jgi:YidC/Oxa1 family membrane protein insertase
VSFYDAEKEWSPREVKAITKVGDELKKDELKKDTADLSHEGSVNWTSLNNKYFAAIIIPQSGDCKLTEIYRTKNEQLGVSAELSGEKPFRFYIGPKEYDRLKSYDLNLEKTVDLGWSWIAPLSLLFLKLLQWSNRLTGNYGVDILILSVVLKVVMIPLTQWSLRSTKSMQLLQPKIAELKEKYKGEPEKLNAETFALYKKYKINPVSGCIPLLLQMPIFIALFNALRYTVELYGAKFVWWITDLSQADALFRLPFVIPLLNTDKFAVLPLLMIVAMVVQNMVSTKGTSGKKGEQQKMMTFLPIIFGFIFYTMPAGLVLYWLVNTVLTVVQQVYMVKPVEALKEA